MLLRICVVVVSDMNIEDLAKDGEKGKPLKKKGYDDVEISDLSDSGKWVVIGNIRRTIS